MPFSLHASDNHWDLEKVRAALVAPFEDDNLRSELHILAAIKIAGREKYSEVTPLLLELAEGKKAATYNRSIHYSAMIALGNIGAVESIPLFKSIVAAAHTSRQSSWGLDTYVGYAFEALGKIANQEAKDILLTAIQELNQMDLDSVQLSLLLNALGDAKVVAATDKIKELLFDSKRSYKVHYAAIDALTDLGTPAAIEHLQNFLKVSHDDQEIAHVKDQILSVCYRKL